MKPACVWKGGQLSAFSFSRSINKCVGADLAALTGCQKTSASISGELQHA